MTLLETLQNNKKVNEIELEPDIFVHLKKGWKLGSDFSQDGLKCQHVFGEDTLSDVRRTLRDVVPCTCDECQSELTETE